MDKINRPTTIELKKVKPIKLIDIYVNTLENLLDIIKITTNYLEKITSKVDGDKDKLTIETKKVLIEYYKDFQKYINLTNYDYRIMSIEEKKQWEHQQEEMKKIYEQHQLSSNLIHDYNNKITKILELYKEYALHHKE